jgi:catechol 2,3-dioxygenase-like lactoylglutathione lyase family enzyme
MRVVGIEHVQLAMPPGAEDVARGFYRDLLGLPEVPKPPHLAVRGGCWFEDGTVKIHLGVEPDFRAARKAHPALSVEGLMALVSNLVAAGYVVTDGDPADAQLKAYVDDPFGNRIELIELPTCG